jgi:hypothetical protein
MEHSIGQEVFMVKKPLRIVGEQSPPEPAAIPAGLEQHGAALWRAVMAEYAVEDIGGREMLAQACHGLDMAARCRAHVDRDGEVIKTKLGLKEHPALRHELTYRSFVVRTLQKLGLDVEPIRTTPGKPPGFA